MSLNEFICLQLQRIYNIFLKIIHHHGNLIKPFQLQAVVQFYVTKTSHLKENKKPDYINKKKGNPKEPFMGKRSVKIITH